MENKRKFKILIVDDSIVIRTFLKDLFASEKDFDIIGTASNPYKARDIMRRNWPDVITLDVEMPRMNGIEFLRKIMRSRPTPVVMISTLTKDRAAITLEALDIGAVDYLPKPEVSTWQVLDHLREEVLQKVRGAATSNIKKRGLMQESPQSRLTITADRNRTLSKVVVIGSSTGGVQALTRIMMRLPKNTPGIAVVQHMPPTFVESLADQLRKKSGLDVKVADHNEPLAPGKVVVAPGNRHLEIVKRSGMYYTQVVEGRAEGYHIPAVNRLFSSAARIGGPDVMGVILTGMGEDGARGMLQMKKNNCRTIGQDQDSSIVYGMPKKAFDLGAVEFQVSLNNISQKIAEFGEGKLK